MLTADDVRRIIEAADYTRDKAFLEKKPWGKNEFEEGIEFGCIAAWLWYLCWWFLAFYVSVKTQNMTYVLGTMSFGVFGGMWLNNIVNLFLWKA